MKLLERIKGALSKNFTGTIFRALGGRPGAWSSDHRAESSHFSGWNGVAIHQIALQAMQCDVACYYDLDAKARAKRRSKSYTTQDESKELPETHALVRLLKRPNPITSGGLFRYECVLQLQLTGTALVWNVPTKSGRGVAERHVIPTAWASPVGTSKETPRGGWRIQPALGRFRGSDPDGFVEMFGGLAHAFGKVIPAEQVQTMRWPHPLYKDDGCSPTSRGASWIDGETQVNESQRNQLHNGADPSIVISVPKDCAMTPDDAERYALKFAEKYGGTNNAGKALFTHGEAKAISTTPRDMAYTEAFRQFRESIFALHGTPTFDADTYSGFYAKLKQFSTMTVQPVLSLLAEEDTERLAPLYGEGLTIEYSAHHIDDPEQLERRLATDISAEVIRKNELRALRGLPPDPEGNAWVGGEKQQASNLSFNLPSLATTATADSTGIPAPAPAVKAASHHKRWKGYP